MRRQSQVKVLKAYSMLVASGLDLLPASTLAPARDKPARTRAGKGLGNWLMVQQLWLNKIIANISRELFIDITGTCIHHSRATLDDPMLSSDHPAFPLKDTMRNTKEQD